MPLTKIFIAIFATDERLPSSATLGCINATCNMTFDEALVIFIYLAYFQGLFDPSHPGASIDGLMHPSLMVFFNPKQPIFDCRKTYAMFY